MIFFKKTTAQIQMGIIICLSLLTASPSLFAASNQCTIQAAQCGVVSDIKGGTVNCGSCDTGETCSANRCEASCNLNQIDKGNFDDLFIYVPNQLTNSDLSPYNHDVSIILLPQPIAEDKTFPFVSRTDLTAKQIDIDLRQAVAASQMTLSFKLMPTNSAQNNIVMQSDAFTIEENSGSIVSTFFGNNGRIEFFNNESSLKNRSCNHFAAVINTDSIQTYFNGQKNELSTDTSTLHTLTDNLKIGPYPGKVWDVRVYNRALSAEELTAIGENCDDDFVRAPIETDYSNYLCSVYQCIWWPEGITDTTMDSFQYQVNAHDMTWEHNVLATGMYKHEGICDEYAKPRDLKLTESYRKSWVSKYDYSKPWNQYVLHENFHAYQSRTGGSTKFLAESTASWGAFSQKPSAYDTILGMYTLQPHLPLWTTQSSPIEEGIIDAYKGGHQYGASIFEYYLTTYIASDKLIGDVFNRETGKPPAEGMFDAVNAAGFDMRDVFSTFAAKTITWDYEHGDTFRQSEEGSYRRMVSQNSGPDGDEGEPWPDDEVDNKIAEFYDANGTGDNWASVPARYKIGSWAYNAYQVNVSADETYTISFKPTPENASYAEFRAQVVVYNEASGVRTYHIIDIDDTTSTSSISVSALANDKLYLVVSSTPSTKFDDWDTYTYEYKITPGVDDTGNNDSDNPGNSDDDSDADEDATQTWWEKLLNWLKKLLVWVNSLADSANENNDDSEGDDNDNSDDDDSTNEDDNEDNTTENTPPVAKNAAYSIEAGQNLHLLLDATDENNDNLTYTITSPPSHGQISGAAPNLTYQPHDGFSGNDRLSFRVNDGMSDSNTAQISLIVNAVSDIQHKKLVFLMAGQSNMVGHGSNSSLEEIDPSLNAARNDVYIKNIIEGSKNLDFLKPGYGGRSSSFGVELKFGHVLGNVIDEDIYLFKASKGGSTLDNVDHWRPLNHGGNDNNLYDQMIQGFDNFQQNELADVDYEIAGFIWFQGYNDTFGTEGLYEGHLRNLLSSVRNDLNKPDLPVIIVQLNDVRGAAGDIVMQAHATVANEDDRNSLVISGDQRPYYHYGAHSYVVIGDRIAQAVLPHLTIPSATEDEYTASPNETLNVNENNGVLKNDTGFNLSAAIIKSVAHGSLSFHSNGSFEYTPDSNFSGQDSFTYQLADNAKNSNTVSVQLWVRDNSNPLVLHYTFDNDTLNHDKNSSLDNASGINAVIAKEGVTFGHGGRNGQSAYFDGQGVIHYLTTYPIVDFLSFSSDEDFSFSLWVKPEGDPSQEQILISNKYYYDRNGGFALTTGGSDKSIKGFVGTHDHQTHKNTKVNFSAGQENIHDGGWHHIAMTVAFSTGTMTLYIDGNNVGETNIGTLKGDINKYESAIGDGSGGGEGNSHAFTGYMDDVKIYRKALSAQEVQQLAQ